MKALMIFNQKNGIAFYQRKKQKNIIKIWLI